MAAMTALESGCWRSWARWILVVQSVPGMHEETANASQVWPPKPTDMPARPCLPQLLLLESVPLTTPLESYFLPINSMANSSGWTDFICF